MFSAMPSVTQLREAATRLRTLASETHPRIGERLLQVARELEQSADVQHEMARRKQSPR